MCAQNHGEWELSIEENHRSLSQTASIHCPDHRKIRQYTTTIDLSSKIKEFVLRQKGNHEFRAFATTVGQKRFLSWDLEGECACHMLSSLKRGKKLQQQELSTTNNFEPVLSDPCCHCGFTFSPVWWTLSPATGSPNIPPSPPKKECHRCHWQKVAK